MHSYPNGRIPSSALKGIPGNGRLWAPAALAYIAMAMVIKAKLGVDMRLIESAMRRTYREFAAQQYARRYWCGLGKCGNAAVPGTSNHGLGIATDLMTMAQRVAVDKLGRAFGFAKAWSDAPQEWWHIRWVEGVWKGHVKAYPRTLRPGASGETVGALQSRLRHGERHKRKPFSRVPAKGKAGHGYYGRTTKAAVKHFQKNHGLTADAVVGPTTWRALGVRPK